MATAGAASNATTLTVLPGGLPQNWADYDPNKDYVGYMETTAWVLICLHGVLCLIGVFLLRTTGDKEYQMLLNSVNTDKAHEDARFRLRNKAQLLRAFSRKRTVVNDDETARRRKKLHSMQNRMRFRSRSKSQGLDKAETQ